MKGIERNIGLVILLSIVTCGIYYLYWIVVTQDEVNDYLGESEMSGVVVLLLTFVTCGIYGYIWWYQLGQRIERMQNKTIGYGSNEGLLYIILCFLGLSIVSVGIAQNNLNKIWQS